MTAPASTKTVAVTGRKDSHLQRAGWAKIVKIDIDTWLDADDRIDFRILWLTDLEGNVWEASAKIGETEEQVAEVFARRAYTNDRCILAFPAKA